MTNTEAIETLKANYPDACYEQLREAVDAAIEALKVQDVTGDMISRQAATQTALEFIIEYLGGAFDEDFQKELAKRMNALPSVQSDDQFEHDIHAMFDHIWDCEINHPIFEDTVGDLMMAVIQCYKKSKNVRKE